MFYLFVQEGEVELSLDRRATDNQQLAMRTTEDRRYITGWGLEISLFELFGREYNVVLGARVSTNIQGGIRAGLKNVRGMYDASRK